MNPVSRRRFLQGVAALGATAATTRFASAAMPAGAAAAEATAIEKETAALAGAHGLLPQDLGFIDTVHVWPGESARVAFDFSHPYSADQDYVFHCHNLEHAELGMMIRYRVTA